MQRLRKYIVELAAALLEYGSIISLEVYKMIGSQEKPGSLLSAVVEPLACLRCPVLFLTSTIKSAENLVALSKKRKYHNMKGLRVICYREAEPEARKRFPHYHGR